MSHAQSFIAPASFDLPISTDGSHSEWINYGLIEFKDNALFSGTRLKNLPRVAELLRVFHSVSIEEIRVDATACATTGTLVSVVSICPSTASAPGTISEAVSFPNSYLVTHSNVPTGFSVRFPRTSLVGIELECQRAAIEKGHPVLLCAANHVVVANNQSTATLLVRVSVLVNCSNNTWAGKTGGATLVV
jgi:hypothetical protein